MYAKYINKKRIEPAPVNYGGMSNFNKNSKAMLAAGYLPVVVVDLPSEEKPNIVYKLTETKIEQYSAPLTSEQLIAQYERYLNDTDWYVTRKAETGVEVPADVLEKRANARVEISNLRGD